MSCFDLGFEGQESSHELVYLCCTRIPRYSGECLTLSSRSAMACGETVRVLTW